MEGRRDCRGQLRGRLRGLFCGKPGSSSRDVGVLAERYCLLPVVICIRETHPLSPQQEVRLLPRPKAWLGADAQFRVGRPGAGCLVRLEGLPLAGPRLCGVWERRMARFGNVGLYV